MFNAFQIRESTIPNARHEDIPMFVNVADKINEQHRERCIKLVHVSVCKEEETMNDEEGRKVFNHGRCPWHCIARYWNTQDISMCRRG